MLQWSCYYYKEEKELRKNKKEKKIEGNEREMRGREQFQFVSLSLDIYFDHASWTSSGIKFIIICNVTLAHVHQLSARQLVE